jgi:hypothetical protein
MAALFFVGSRNGVGYLYAFSSTEVAVNLTCVGADTWRGFDKPGRESMNLDKVASVGTTRLRAAQLER